MGFTNSAGYIEIYFLLRPQRYKNRKSLAQGRRREAAGIIQGETPIFAQIFWNMVKWFGAILGYFLFRLPGALLGFFLGSLVDGMNKGGGSIFRDLGRAQVSPQDFELHLISLCSIVIKADGSVTQQELNYVRQ
jgi:hypothetical protein